MHKNDCQNFGIGDFLHAMGVRAPIEPGPDLGIAGDALRFRYTATAAGSTQAIQGTAGIAATDPNVNTYCTPATDTKWWLILLAYRFTVAHKDANTADMVSALLNGTYMTHTPQGQAVYVYQAMPGGSVDVGGFGLQAQAAAADLTRTWARAETPFVKRLVRPVVIDMESDALVITSPAVASLTDCFVTVDVVGWAVPKKEARTADLLFAPDGASSWVREQVQGQQVRRIATANAAGEMHAKPY